MLGTRKETKTQKATRAIAARFGISYEDANTLRRAQLTLHAWDEAECGSSDAESSWSIERDDETGIPYRCIYPHKGTMRHRYRIPDREKGALKRVAKVCAANGLFFYHQGDCRGCSLYVSRVPMTDSNYNSTGFPVL